MPPNINRMENVVRMNNTHMPFMANHGADVISLCCRKVGGFWKLHRKIDGDWVRLNTRRQTDAIECSPTAEWRDGQWHITFIAGGAEEDRLFRLYEYVDGEVAMIKEPAYVGFRNRKMLVHGGRARSFTVEMGTTKKVFESENLDELFRISYDPIAPSCLLISGRYNGAVFSWRYNIGNNRAFDIEADDGVAYKCAFFREKCYYAKQIGEGFEDREVVEAQKVKITPLGDNLLTVRWEE